MLRIAAFSDGAVGGNPAGVVIVDVLPTEAEMQRIAAEVGFSETAFAAPQDGAWRVRYFAPQREVPFCGHATIALGAALALREGDGTFTLRLNEATITIAGRREGATGTEGTARSAIAGALQSLPTWSKPASAELVSAALRLFGYREADLDPRIPPALTHAGANHLILALKSRPALAAMRYELESGRAFMERAGVVTILLAYAEGPQRFHTRNPLSSWSISAMLCASNTIYGWRHRMLRDDRPPTTDDRNAMFGGRRSSVVGGRLRHGLPKLV